jgi:2-amino-4-hydroxy-6-hydroxymethyldihydropteridine diphosphokinase
MTTVYLALGSNVGDSEANIGKAVELLAENISDIRLAPLYKTKPVGYTDQPDFVNTALSGQTGLSADELLKFVKSVEKEVGRIQRFRWGPREIDIDIIFYGKTVLETQQFTLPHPRFRERDFVLRPLCDLDPDFTDPVSGKTVAELLSALDPSGGSVI